MRQFAEREVREEDKVFERTCLGKFIKALREFLSSIYIIVV